MIKITPGGESWESLDNTHKEIMTIKAEFIAGTEITQAFFEAIRVAKILNCNIEFQFNGVTCIAEPNGDHMKGSSNYNNSLESKVNFKIAFSS